MRCSKKCCRHVFELVDLSDNEVVEQVYYSRYIFERSIIEKMVSRFSLRAVFFRAVAFVVFVFSARVSFCGEFAWRASEDGSAYIWSDDERDFSWSGSSVEGFADGAGVLSFSGGSAVLAKFTCGARAEDFHDLSFSGDFYAGEGRGEGSGKIPDGRGILIKSNGNVYLGDFRKGRVDGFAARYFRIGGNLSIVYRGEFKNGYYDGQGELYEGGEIVYMGNFKSGKRDGAGTEFQDGLSVSGKFKKDVKNGAFKISGRGIVREVEFKNGVPKLSDCTVTYTGGVVWRGALDEKFDPKDEGTVLYSTGDVYEGEVESNKRNGFGTFTSADGVSYAGEWLDDKCTGFGEAFFGDKWFYSGNWENNSFSGQGVLNAGDYRYRGEWKDGQKNGFGSLSMGGAHFDGEFKDDMLNGQGLMVYPNGDYYDGNWVDSRQEGYGEYYWADGGAYFGEWVDDLQNGEGELYLANGDSYAGEFFDGKYEGNGVFRYASGDRYEGEFKDNLKSGVGAYYFADGNSYEGEFKEDRIEGTGKFFFTDGSFYDGQFLDGVMMGKGALYIPEGDEFVILTSSIWSGNVLPCRGSLLFPNGDEFIGTLEDGKPTSDGVWKRKGAKTAADKAYDFYKAHEQTIKRVTSTTQLVLAGISIGGDIVAAVTMVPCPPVAGVALAVSKIADIANASISGLNIIVGTGVMVRDTENARALGDEKEVARLRKEYFKEQAWNAADVALTFGSAAFKAVRASRAAKKAAEIYPGIQQAIKNSGVVAEVARSAKVGDKLVRGTVEIAYGKVGRTLVKQYGDDAARMLFKYGDNAVFALTKGGDMTLKVAKKGGERALKAVFANGESALDVFSKNMGHIDEICAIAAKQGRSGLKLVSEFGGKSAEFFRAYSKWGDEIFVFAKKAGKENRKIFAELLIRDGDEFLDVIRKTGKNPDELNRTLKYLSQNGKEGLLAIKKLGGKLPDSASIRRIRSASLSKINLGRIESRVASFRKKGAIKLSDRDMAWILKDPKVNLRAMIRSKTGSKTLGEGFQEFFIRVADGDSRRVQELMAVPEIKKTVNHAIRGGGGVHEWLMTKNYVDFLTNTKWGKDGPAISLALTELVQDTKTVAFKNGGTHFDKMNSGKFHDGLAKVIDSSDGAKSLLENVRTYASTALTKESFEEFMQIFERCFGSL